MKKPWSGRFSQETARGVEQYTESISFDRRLWKYDIEGGIAHAKMLARQKIISDKESEQIVTGLRQISAEIENGKFVFRDELEDIHMNIEAALIERIGEAGGKLHTARSRNDQVALDLRLYLRDEVQEMQGLLICVEAVLLDLAEGHIGIIMPGYTHLQRAQPVLLSHHLAAYAHMFDRDRERLIDLYKRLNVLPLGSCALAGTTLPIDRLFVAELLGFDAVTENSMDAVADRDFAVEFLACAAICIMHVSRLAEDLILWCTEEFGFISMPDAFTTGSSIMPQKKNPDVAELMRGKTGRIYGNLMSLLTTLKGIPLTYNRDLQEDKEPVFDTVDTLKSTLSLLADMMQHVTFNSKRMTEASGAGFSTATDIAEYLVSKGVPFRSAHEITGRLVLSCIESAKAFTELTLDEFKSFSRSFEGDIFACITAAASVNARRTFGGTSIESVKEQIRRFRDRLNDK